MARELVAGAEVEGGQLVVLDVRLAIVATTRELNAAESRVFAAAAWRRRLLTAATIWVSACRSM